MQQMGTVLVILSRKEYPRKYGGVRVETVYTINVKFEELVRRMGSILGNLQRIM